MASRGDFGYGAISEFHDDPSMPSRPVGSGGAASGLPGPFAELSEQVGADIFAIGNHAHSLDRVGAQITEDADIAKIRSNITGIQQQIAVRIQSASMNLKEMVSLQEGARGRVANQEKLHLDRLRKEFQDAVQQFSNTQKRVADKMKSAFVNKNREKPKPALKTSVWMDDDDLMMTDDQKSEMAGLIAHDEVNHEQRQTQLLLEQEQAEADLAIFQERQDAILQLERDVIDINDMFKELGAMVSEQGEVIGSIEDNVTKAGDAVEVGAEHLEKAKVYQAKSRKKMCWLLLILIVVAAVVALVLYFSLK